MAVALRPRSWPITGTRKVCTSQHDDSIQFKTMRRRKSGLRSKSQDERLRPSAGCGALGNSCVRRTHHQANQGSDASNRKAQRKPAASISKPASSGPRKLEIEGPTAIQLNTWRSSVASWASRPTWRCSAIMAIPLAAPQAVAERHSTQNAGQATASMAPALATATATRTGWRKPCRSAKRPAGKASTAGETANKASSTPTDKAL